MGVVSLYWDFHYWRLKELPFIGSKYHFIGMNVYPLLG